MSTQEIVSVVLAILVFAWALRLGLEALLELVSRWSRKP